MEYHTRTNRKKLLRPGKRPWAAQPSDKWIQPAQQGKRAAKKARLADAKAKRANAREEAKRRSEAYGPFWTKDRRRRILHAYAVCGDINAACRTVKVNRKGFYGELSVNPTFAAEYTVIRDDWANIRAQEKFNADLAKL